MEFHAVDVLAPQFDAAAFLPAAAAGPPVDVVFVCLADEALALLAGTRLADMLAAHAVPVVVRVAVEDGLGRAVCGRWPWPTSWPARCWSSTPRAKPWPR